MRNHGMKAALLLTTILGMGLISCGGGSSECTGSIPMPSLKSVRPSTIDSQASSTTISLSGSGFISTSKVYLNSVLLASAVVDSHHITATVTSGNLIVAGTGNGVEIWVTNPGVMGGGFFGCSDGGSSQGISITVT